MEAQCPKCKDQPLTAGSPAPGLSEDHEVLQCSTCHGTWLSRTAAEQMVADGEAPAEIDELTAPRNDADRRTGVCPHGHGIMLRARVHLSEPFYLERCPHCGGIWFDAGEWNRLAGSYLLDHLQDFWNPAWQHRMRRQQDHQKYQERLRDELGEEVFARLARLARDLKEHPRKARALAFLRQEIRS